MTVFAADKIYSHIIVGAGAAGCVIAARLSERPGNSVLLLERGPVANALVVDMPAAFSNAIASGRFSETFLSDDPSAISQFQGRAVGGSSAINGMMYLRGHRDDYDGWARSGCEGWSFADVLPYFLKAEGHATRGAPFHAAAGPLGVETPSRDALFGPQHAFLDAGAEAGFPVNDDFNGADQEGFGVYDRTVKAGTRASTARAYLDPARGRSNLTIVPNARALSLEIDDRRVTGVRIEHRGDRQVVRGAEIVLAAGAYASPHLLMLSGIGDAEQLLKAGVTPHVDLPGVGRNLQNHPSVSMMFRSNGSDSLLPLLKGSAKVINGLKWLLMRRGPYARNHLEVGAFLRSDPSLGRPDLQLIFANMAIDRSRMKPFDFHSFQTQIVLVRPDSRGTVSLRPGDLSRPSVRLNYLDTETDRRAMLAGFRIARRLASTPALSAAGTEVVPGAEIEEDEAVLNWLTGNMGSLFHPIGTCRMGSAGDRGAVVDPSLKVHGILNLRVADASIMPVVPAGNTYAPAVMIAEKAAALLSHPSA